MSGIPLKVEIMDHWEVVGSRLNFVFEDDTFLHFEFDGMFNPERPTVLHKAEIKIDGVKIDLLKPLDVVALLVKSVQYLNIAFAFELTDWEFGPENSKMILALIGKIMESWK